MIPKKPNDLYKQVAEDLNISESLVDAFMTFYYKEIRKNLSELNHTQINLDGLGVMAVKPKTIDALINKYSNMVKTTDTNTISKYSYKKKLEDKIELLNQVKDKLGVQKELKEKFLKDKKDEQSSRDLEK
jgi:nucleoid DNA-binding protein